MAHSDQPVVGDFNISSAGWRADAWARSRRRLWRVKQNRRRAGFSFGWDPPVGWFMIASERVQPWWEAIGPPIWQRSRPNALTALSVIQRRPCSLAGKQKRRPLEKKQCGGRS